MKLTFACSVCYRLIVTMAWLCTTVVAYAQAPFVYLAPFSPSYCPHDRWIETTIQEPANFVAGTPIPAGVVPTQYLFLASGAVILTGPGGNVISADAASGYTASLSTLRFNFYLLSLSGGYGQYDIAIPYQKYEYAMVGGVLTTVLDVPVVIHERFTLQRSPVSFHFSDPNDPLASVICNNAEPITLNGTPRSGDYMVNGSRVGLTFGPAEVLFNPRNVPPNRAPGTTTLFTYTSGTGACATLEAEARLLDIPDVSFANVIGCSGEALQFTPLETGGGAPLTDYTYYWEFGDGPGTAANTGNLAPATHTYTLPGFYTAKLSFDLPVNLGTDQFKTCSGRYTQNINIRETPTVDFAWEQVCIGTATRFKATVSPPLMTTAVRDVWWDFDGSGFVKGSFEESYNYTMVGSRPASVKVETQNNCSAVATHHVYTVGAIKQNQLPYVQPFSFAQIPGWCGGIEDETNPLFSWNFGTPTGHRFNGDASLTGWGAAWFTSTGSPGLNYHLGEKSWIHSPCFDLSAVQRPLLSVDIRCLMQQNLDGVVLQVDSTELTSGTDHWVTVGRLSETETWYNGAGLPGKPGDQNLNQFGWTGEVDTIGWRTAIIALDNYLPALAENRKKIRFRFALGSQTSDLGKPLDGFAFDNFSVGERNRTTLLEYFTNAATTAAGKPVDDFAFRPGATLHPGLIKLEYHLGAPQADEINATNEAVHNARAAYYGVANQPPVVIVDGELIAPPYAGSLPVAYAKRATKFPAASIDGLTVVQRANGHVGIQVDYSLSKELPEPLKVQVAIVEKLATANNNNYRYVVRDLVYDATGYLISRDWAPPTSGSIKLDWVPNAHRFSDVSDLAAVAFIQSEDTREVHAAALVPSLTLDLSVITASESLVSGESYLYPNPTSEYVYIVGLKRPPASITVVNAVGQQHAAVATWHDDRVRIDISLLPEGFYFADLEVNDTRIRKKFLVVR